MTSKQNGSKAKPTRQGLEKLAREYLDDAEILYENGRYRNAAHLCGYVLEFSLKARMCRILCLEEYPEKIQGLKTHGLEDLLCLSGARKVILDKYSAEWNAVSAWDPAHRYFAEDVSEVAARSRIEVTKIILNAL